MKAKLTKNQPYYGKHVVNRFDTMTEARDELQAIAERCAEQNFIEDREDAYFNDKDTLIDGEVIFQVERC